MSVFDPAAFMEESVDQPMETRFVPVPEGEYEAFIGSDEKSVVTRTAGEAVVLDVFWEIPDPAVKQAMGFEGDRKPTVKQSVFLDLVEQGGKLKLDHGKNKNVRLGRLREALGQNQPGPWSPSKLRGAGPAIITVKHRPDQRDATIVYAEVAAVAPRQRRVARSA